MSKNTVLALGTGIVIGAAGMWFFGSDTETFEVEEFLEGYGIDGDSDHSGDANCGAENGEEGSCGEEGACGHDDGEEGDKEDEEGKCGEGRCG